MRTPAQVWWASLLFLGCLGCGGETNKVLRDSIDYGWQGTRIYHVVGADAFAGTAYDVEITIVNRYGGPVTIHLTSTDGAFTNSPVTTTSGTATNFIGVAINAAGDPVAVEAVLNGNTLTLRLGQTATGTGGVATVGRGKQVAS